MFSDQILAVLWFVGFRSAIGQKASQTAENITAADGVLEKLPVVRPLVGMNKLEIERYARKIGTYQISISPGVATCGVPTHNPSTSAKLLALNEIEKRLDIPEMVERGLSSARIIDM